MKIYTHHFCGVQIVIDPVGAMYLPEYETLVVSDLHFEKGSSFAGKGALLPPYDTRATLRHLADLLGAYHPKKVISLGDSFHDPYAEQRMSREDSALLGTLTQTSHWIWVLGNHDPHPPKKFTGDVVDVAELGGLHFQHEADRQGAPGEVSGHYHPCAKILVEGRTVRRKCVVMDESRLIMPALGAFTGGLNVLDPALRSLFGPAVGVCALGRQRVFTLTEDYLVPDRMSIRA